MYLLNLIRKYKNRSFDPSQHLLRIEIDSKNLQWNISQFKNNYPNHRLAAVLKSNAYGHGLKEIGRFLDKNKEVDFLVVDSIVEAQTLRDIGVVKPIILLGYVPKSCFSLLSKIKKLILVVNSVQQAQLLQSLIDFNLSVHIKVDTGMNRQGVGIDELEEVINILRKNKRIKIEGMLSHLADADSSNPLDTLKQLSKWQTALFKYKKLISKSDSCLFHFSNTAGLGYLSNQESNLIRVGIGLYGFDTTKDRRLNLKPVLSFWAKIVNLKKVKAGEKIGYNFSFTAPKDMTIAVIPCGYYEGVPRTLSNKGYFYFKDVPLPILGKVSMNLSVVDVSNVKQLLNLEDEVEVYSNNPAKKNSIDNVSKICNTIPYEVLVRLAPTIRRVVI
jgi:alanine racemase